MKKISYEYSQENFAKYIYSAKSFGETFDNEPFIIDD